MRHPLTIVLLLCLAGPVGADDGVVEEFDMSNVYQFGIDRHELDDYTRVTGWQVADRWYFGKTRGDDSGIGFVWQREADQLSVSTGGIRLIRRF